MESLNYTQLASVVLVLSVASLLLFIISLILVVIIRKQKSNASQEFKLIDKRLATISRECVSNGKNLASSHEEFFQKTQTLRDKIETVDKLLSIAKKNIYDHLEARINTLFKPAYKIGDKVETTDGIKGTITHISKDKDGFMYEITERSYFNRPAKKHNRIEFLLMKS